MKIEQLLNIEIVKKDKELQYLSTSLQVLKDQIDSIRKEKEELFAEMRRVCTHPTPMIEDTKDYEEGSYLSVSRTTWIKKCRQCNSVISTATETSTYA